MNHTPYHHQLPLSLILLLGCGGGSQQSVVLPIYNQAYQENFEPDSLEVIRQEAEDAYVLLDPFNHPEVPNAIDALHAKGNSLSAYISIGTGEAWRDDFEELQPYLSTQMWKEWEGEYYLSVISPEVVEVMHRRIDQIAQWGFDWIEFDNMDWYSEETKAQYHLTLTQEEADAYVHELCDYTHQKGMQCMAKNRLKGFEAFDGITYESSPQIFNWWDHQATQSFLDAHKLVIINHYNESNCDLVYADYQAYYQTQGISFICEDIHLKTYRHYHQKP